MVDWLSLKDTPETKECHDEGGKAKGDIVHDDHWSRVSTPVFYL